MDAGQNRCRVGRVVAISRRAVPSPDLLAERGIKTSVHFIPLHRFTYYKGLGYSSDDYPVSEWIFERVLSLPIYPGMSDEETDYVIDQIYDIIKLNKR